jgi:hypothetical protein
MSWRAWSYERLRDEFDATDLEQVEALTRMETERFGGLRLCMWTAFVAFHAVPVDTMTRILREVGASVLPNPEHDR